MGSEGWFLAELRPWNNGFCIEGIVKLVWCHMAGPEIGILHEAFIKNQLF